MLLITIPAVVIVYQKRRLLGAMIGVVTVLITIPVQSRLHEFHKRGIARVIAIGHAIINRTDFGQKTVELLSPVERMTHPDQMPVGARHQAEQGIGDDAKFVIFHPGTLGGTGVMNVAQNSECDLSLRAGFHAG